MGDDGSTPNGDGLFIMENPTKLDDFSGNHHIQRLKYHPHCCAPRLIVGRKVLGHPAFTGAHDWHPKICQAVAGQGLWRGCSSDPHVTLVSQQLVATRWRVVNSRMDTVDVVQPFNKKIWFIHDFNLQEKENIAHQESSRILPFIKSKSTLNTMT